MCSKPYVTKRGLTIWWDYWGPLLGRETGESRPFGNLLELFLTPAAGCWQADPHTKPLGTSAVQSHASASFWLRLPADLPQPRTRLGLQEHALHKIFSRCLSKKSCVECSAEADQTTRSQCRTAVQFTESLFIAQKIVWRTILSSPGGLQEEHDL